MTRRGFSRKRMQALGHEERKSTGRLMTGRCYMASIFRAFRAFRGFPDSWYRIQDHERHESHERKKLPIAAWVLVTLAVAASLLPGAAGWLQFDRLAIANGELWRLVSAHFVHWSGEHLFWDVLALGMLGWLCEREGPMRFLACLAVSAVAIPAILWFAEPGMATYRGLSGLDSALFAMLAGRIITEASVERDWTRLSLAGLVTFGFAAKVGFELVTGATLFVDSAAAGMTPIPLAHVAGGLVGLLFGVNQGGVGCPARWPVPFCETRKVIRSTN
jgi:rhomboid family GlyGly-CTERM serine protease